MNSFLKKIIYYLAIFNNRFILKKKIRKILRNIGKVPHLSDDQVSQFRKIWKRINKKPSLKWYKAYYAINNVSEPQYISEPDYYHKVEPILNHKTFCEAYADKNFYHKIIDGKFLPKVYLRSIQGEYYSQSYAHIDDFNQVFNIIPESLNRLIIKSSIDTSGGQDIGLFSKENNIWLDPNGNKLEEEYALKKYGTNYIIQQYILQHPYFERFNESSVNTVRLFTYRSVRTNEIIPIQAVLRFGNKGAIVDNQASGGFACGIDTNGKLNHFAINKWGYKIFEHNKITFSQIDNIPKYNDIKTIGKQLAVNFHYHRLLGFDFTIDQNDRIILLEINNKNHEINFYQMNNGPLFKEYTDEIIHYCMGNKISVQFDFNI